MSKKLDKQLLAAAKNGDFAAVKKAIESGANINTADGWVLGEAASSTHPDAFAIVRHLIESGAEKSNQWILHNAAMNTNPDAFAIVKYLVENGVCVDRQMLRSVMGSTNPDAFAMFRYLIEHGQRCPDGSWKQADINANGILGSVSSCTNPDTLATVKYLVEHGRRCPNGSGGQAVEDTHGTSSMCDINADDAFALRHAADSDNPDALAIVEYLVEHGANIHQHDFISRTPFTMALIHGNNDVAEYLFSLDNSERQSQYFHLTPEDIKTLDPIVKKISSMKYRGER